MHKTTRELLHVLRASRPGDAARLLLGDALERWHAADCPDAPAPPKWSATTASGHSLIFEAPTLVAAASHAVKRWPDTVGVQRVDA